MPTACRRPRPETGHGCDGSGNSAPGTGPERQRKPLKLPQPPRNTSMRHKTCIQFFKNLQSLLQLAFTLSDLRLVLRTAIFSGFQVFSRREIRLAMPIKAPLPPIFLPAPAKKKTLPAKVRPKGWAYFHSKDGHTFTPRYGHTFTQRMGILCLRPSLGCRNPPPHASDSSPPPPFSSS